MAKQLGTHPVTGTIDGFTYYYHKDHGFLMRRKGGPTKRQVKKDRSFDIPRRNNKEFGRASHYGKMLRTAFRGMTCYCRESKMYSRLSTRIREIMKLDKVSTFGERYLRKDNLTAFTHFEWDQWNLSTQYFELPVETTVTDGCLEVTIGLSLQKRPRNADAWKVMSIAAVIDLEKSDTKVDKQEGELYAFEKGDFADSFTHYVAEAGALFHGMCIVFYRYDATIDDYRPIKEKHVNAGFVRFISRSSQ